METGENKRAFFFFLIEQLERQLEALECASNKPIIDKFTRDPITKKLEIIKTTFELHKSMMLT